MTATPTMTAPIDEPRPNDREEKPRTNWRGSAPFMLIHLTPLLIIFTGVTTTAVVLAVVLFFVRQFAITGGYHRYFAHRGYRTGRTFQFLLAAIGGSAVQKGALWWASNHRAHHRYADTERDPHSPNDGFWWAHVGWVLSGAYGVTDYESIDEYAKYPELVWLNKHDWVAPWTLAALCFLVGGWSGLVVGFLLSTILLWHATFLVNSMAHVFGGRRYETNDTSRNSAIVAALTLGEGWHNNHHHYPPSARQGFFWWEIDVTYYGLRALQVVGIVHDLREPTAAAKTARRRIVPGPRRFRAAR